jgi:hypothetical protein
MKIIMDETGGDNPLEEPEIKTEKMTHFSCAVDWVSWLKLIMLRKKGEASRSSKGMVMYIHASVFERVCGCLILVPSCRISAVAVPIRRIQKVRESHGIFILDKNYLQRHGLKLARAWNLSNLAS